MKSSSTHDHSAKISYNPQQSLFDINHQSFTLKFLRSKAQSHSSSSFSRHICTLNPSSLNVSLHFNLPHNSTNNNNISTSEEKSRKLKTRRVRSYNKNRKQRNNDLYLRNPQLGHGGNHVPVGRVSILLFTDFFIQSSSSYCYDSFLHDYC